MSPLPAPPCPLLYLRFLSIVCRKGEVELDQGSCRRGPWPKLRPAETLPRILNCIKAARKALPGSWRVSGYRDPTTDVLHHALRCPRFQEAPSSCSRGELSTEAWSSWWRQRVLPEGMASWLMASSSAWRALTVRHFLLQLSTRSCNWQVHAVTVSPPHMVYTSS